MIGGTIAADDDALAAGFFAADELPELAFPSTLDAARRTSAQQARTAQDVAPERTVPHTS